MPALRVRQLSNPFLLALFIYAHARLYEAFELELNMSMQGLRHDMISQSFYTTFLHVLITHLRWARLVNTSTESSP